MKTIKGPGIFLAQFIGTEAPFNTLDGLAEWAAGLGFKALQLPCNHPGIFNLEQAAASQNGRLMLCITSRVPSGGPTVQPILRKV